MAFVLPFDATYVRYGRPLWAFLARSFSSLRVVRVRERVFPEILQDVILLLASGFGGATGTVELETYEQVGDLVAGRGSASAAISVERVIAGERPFLEGLLADELRHLLAGRLREATVPARELVRFRIGYVSGDKRFFHPDEETVRRFGLPARHLVPALGSSRRLRGAGVRTSGASPPGVSRLYLPGPGALARGERQYIAEGDASGVSGRYKCRIRDPWFVTPGVEIPDVVVPVFADAPVLLENDAGYAASNSLLCGYLRPGMTSASVLARWYTSLTLLQIELEVHSLGGGVRVFVPNEAGAIRLPEQARASPRLLGRADALVRAGAVTEAYEAGDEPVLERQLGLTPPEIGLIRDGIAVLAGWRTSSRTSRQEAA